MPSAKLLSQLAVSESGFVFLPGSGETFTVNEVGRKILSGLQNGRTDEEIVEELCREFEVELSDARRDVEDFFAQLRHYRLLDDENKDFREKQI